MTANQTIDGVKRDLLAGILEFADECWHGFPGEEELRALLDAPAAPVTPCAIADALEFAQWPNTSIGNKVLVATAITELRKAAQPQGEPVAIPAMPEMFDRRPGWPDGYMESDNDWCDNNPLAVSWLADNHAAIRDALYAEQPAPVAPEQTSCDSVDFRLLLNKYIEHVGQCEGVDFISYIGDGPGSDVPFDLAEIAELKRLQEYPMKELLALPNDPATNVRLIGLTPKGAGRITIGKGAATPRLVVTSEKSAREVQIATPHSVCRTCGGNKRIILDKQDFAILMGRCPDCNPEPVASVPPEPRTPWEISMGAEPGDEVAFKAWRESRRSGTKP